MMGAQIAATATFCMVLFRARSRTIHRLYVLPSEVIINASLAKKHKRALVLQNVWQFSGQGKVLPFAGTLERGTHDGEVILSTPEEGSYILPLENVKINGKPYDSAHSVKETLFKEWYGPKKGSMELTRHGWVD
ncbi:hypothetical protein PHLGIDRAFT_350208 [Phlebiopsis gigantea 11061_1 CR5-6]|uniref:Uncharacterized protein n=1 Tax=Phlebiopsis gigantea (strain 11061_1 CR5-6) TaxID=745531 RepID=A0A0C3S1J1_PHLG1|nr:hypothetical protein PHLGIDRAFT_350208 [Phlebiopsis gigantea 11061_1 CR5-6]